MARVPEGSEIGLGEVQKKGLPDRDAISCYFHGLCIVLPPSSPELSLI